LTDADGQQGLFQRLTAKCGEARAGADGGPLATTDPTSSATLETSLQNFPMATASHHRE
jgi:hypothetical protein